MVMTEYDKLLFETAKSAMQGLLSNSAVYQQRGRDWIIENAVVDAIDLLEALGIEKPETFENKSHHPVLQDKQ